MRRVIWFILALLLCLTQGIEQRPSRSFSEVLRLIEGTGRNCVRTSSNGVDICLKE